MLSYQEERALEKNERKEAFRIGTVVEKSGKRCRVKFDGEDEASTKYYMKNDEAYFSINDRVLCAAYKGTYILICTLGG